jgi:hypothetical protein
VAQAWISTMVRSVQQGRRPASRATRPTRTENMRRGLRQLFAGTSVVEMTTSPEAPKTPRLELASQDFQSTRITLPHLSRAATAPATISRPNSTASPITPPSAHTPVSSRPITSNSLREMQRSMSLPQSETRSSSRQFVGVDPEEQYLADLAARGRRRQSKRARRCKGRHSCVVNFKDRKIRSKIIACCLSAIFLLIILTICKISTCSPFMQYF